ncbi:MAG: hypothetical protein EA339_00250 [Rhodobacteraceae bacterium]|nr:MAG: hypothetical protein EA339_00250 [Paracoccaceae bacterium]
MKASVLGLAYGLTGYPDLRQWQMRHLFKAGPGRWQTPRLHDPLFSCALVPLPLLSSSAETTPAPGRYFAEFGFLGVKLNATLSDPDAVAAGKVALRLNGHTLRDLGLIPVSEGRARLLYTIRRPALAMFPPRAVLSLHDARGAALAVDLRYFPGRAVRDARQCHAIEIAIPFGDGRIFDHLAATGPLDKKGWPQPDRAAVHARQDQMLALYSRVRQVFDEDIGLPLFVLYGTLLGQYRGGDFIPGDDDFDVGYVSDATGPAAFKAEAMQIMERLVARGFIVGLNHLGRPHRVRDAQSGVEIHLDNHAVFAPGDGHVWLHPRARLPLSLDGFREVEKVQMRGVEVLRPVGTEAFLAAHYGPGWRVPDPGYANITTSPDRRVAQQLSALCLTRAEQRAFAQRLVRQGLPGDFIAVALEPPYPLDRYAARVGF